MWQAHWFTTSPSPAHPPPLLLTSPLHSAHASFYPSHSPPFVTQSSSPIALFLHFISLQSSFFIHSFLPFFFPLIINALLMIFSISQIPLIRCSLLPPFSTSLLCLSAFLFFSFTFFFITFFTFWNSKWASEWGKKGDISGTIVGATWAGIWESAHLLGFSPYHNHL